MKRGKTFVVRSSNDRIIAFCGISSLYMKAQKYSAGRTLNSASSLRETVSGLPQIASPRSTIDSNVLGTSL